MNLKNDTTPIEGGEISSATTKSTEPSLSELIGAVEHSATAPDGKIDDFRQKLTEQRLKERETKREGLKKYYELRDKWSRYIRDYVWAMILFQALVTASIGFKWVDFTQYKTLINLIIGQNFAQIVGMGVIVAKFLFSDPKRDN